MIESGILMKNSKVLIPETLKQKYPVADTAGTPRN